MAAYTLRGIIILTIRVHNYTVYTVNGVKLSGWMAEDDSTIVIFLYIIIMLTTVSELRTVCSRMLRLSND